MSWGLKGFKIKLGCLADCEHIIHVTKLSLTKTRLAVIFETRSGKTASLRRF